MTAGAGPIPAPLPPLRAPSLCFLDASLVVGHQHADDAGLDPCVGRAPHLDRLDGGVGRSLVREIPDSCLSAIKVSFHRVTVSRAGTATCTRTSAMPRQNADRR